MPRTYRKIVTTLALGATGANFGLSGVTAAPQMTPHAHQAMTHTAHRRVPTPPDSYLQYKVYTVDQLIQQVADNPAVRRRFARHFQLPENRVVEYMRTNLVESYIPKTGRYTVYCARRSGKFYPVRQTFHRGTRVFALRNGEPVMKWVCGNPLTKFASTVTDVVASRPATKLKPSIVAEFIPSDLENEVVPTEAAQVQVSPSLQSLVSPVSSAVGNRSSNLAYGFLPALGLLGLNTGGSKSNIVTPEVPEATPLVYLAIGVPIFFLGVRRRMSKEVASAK